MKFDVPSSWIAPFIRIWSQTWAASRCELPLATDETWRYLLPSYGVANGVINRGLYKAHPSVGLPAIQLYNHTVISGLIPHYARHGFTQCSNALPSSCLIHKHDGRIHPTNIKATSTNATGSPSPSLVTLSAV